MGVKRLASDEWFSHAIRWRDNWTCRHCHAEHPPPTKVLQCAHIVGRGVKATRYCADNALALCAGCHKYFTERPMAFTSWLRGELGEGLMELIEEKAAMIGKDDAKTRAEVAAHYRRYVQHREKGVEIELISWN
jgi:hypothetical protein